MGGGFECCKCYHKKSQARKDFSRTCNICSHQESATAIRFFHKVNFGVRKAFFIGFERAPVLRVFRPVMLPFVSMLSKNQLVFYAQGSRGSGGHPMDGKMFIL